MTSEVADGVARLPFGFWESKFRPPRERAGIVRRAALVDRLAAVQEPVIAVVAPPGYGKTTLLAQWAGQVDPRVAWVSCDDGDNDPVVLLAAVAVALDRIEPVDPGIFGALVSSSAGIVLAPRLMAAFASVSRPVRMVFDNAEAVTSQECLMMLAEFAVRLPQGWQLAFGSRTRVPLPVARLRAQGGIVEVSAGDLAMDRKEASALLASAGAEMGEAGIGDLLERTEGWPAGLYIAALAMKAGIRPGDVGFTFTGDDVFMGDYLRSELLDRVSPAEASFLTRTSVLDRLCGPLCDAILARKGSQQVLEQLESRNLLVVPLDRHREWYRYHPLLQDLLQAELRRREPELGPDLHFRAASWYEANAMPETAIGHAQEAGDYDRVARLVLEVAQPVWVSGRAETVLRWMESLRDITSAEHYGAIAVHASLICALLGQPSEAERWVAAAERASPAGILPDGNTMAATLAYLRALLCRDGPAVMRRDAQAAWDGLNPASPYRATMLYTEGISYLLEDDLDRADQILVRAFGEADRVGAPPLAAVILAERCIVAEQRGDWPEAMRLVQQAVTIVEAGQFDDYWTSALVYAWASRAALHGGKIAEARSWLGRAARLRPLLSYVLPVMSVQALLEMARCYLALSDPGGAIAVLNQVRDILQQRPDLGSLSRQAAQLRAEPGRNGAPDVGASSLTAAELRLLPLLSTHLSYQEIGERLYVSKNTVKSQAYSVFRKLGASSRSEAVSRARDLGLDYL